MCGSQNRTTSTTTPSAPLVSTASSRWRPVNALLYARRAGHVAGCDRSIGARAPRVVHRRNQDDQAWEFNVTGCRYADFFRSLGEPDMGATRQFIPLPPDPPASVAAMS